MFSYDGESQKTYVLNEEEKKFQLETMSSIQNTDTFQMYYSFNNKSLNSNSLNNNSLNNNKLNNKENFQMKEEFENLKKELKESINDLQGKFKVQEKTEKVENKTDSKVLENQVKIFSMFEKFNDVIGKITEEQEKYKTNNEFVEFKMAQEKADIIDQICAKSKFNKEELLKKNYKDLCNTFNILKNAKSGEPQETKDDFSEKEHSLDNQKLNMESEKNHTNVESKNKNIY